MKRFPAEVAAKLKHYVYLYVDPRDGEVFYIGRGRGNRCFDHLNDTSESDKVEQIAEIAASGKTPRIELLRYGLSADAAVMLETAAIDLLRVDRLTNRVRGSGARLASRVPVEHVAAELNPKPVEVAHPVVFIKINQLYRADMTDRELYDATRSAWRVNPKAKKPEYALAVFRGVIREVYAIAAWLEAGSTMVEHRKGERSNPDPERFEFVGRIADADVRDRYRNRTVPPDVQRAQNPIRYANC